MKRYESYKDSGVKWIGEIPSHWGLSRVKKYFRERSVIVSDKEFPPLSVTRNGIVPQLGDVAKTDNHDNRKLVHKNDFVINSRSDRKGSSGVSIYNGSVSLINIILEPISIFPFYSGYLFKSTEFIEEFFRNGKGIHWDLWSTRYTELQNIIIPIPPISEQHQIVTYLDTKTAQIDDLIQKKERKIELLKEYRTALINKVVTKGLNPDVEMKDSGVEWIGEIPRHWGLQRLKCIAEVKPSNVDKHIYPDEKQVRLCNYTDVYYNDFISETTLFKNGSCTIAEYEKFKLVKGDVIITKDSESPDDIGVPSLVIDDFSDLVCGYHLTLIRTIEGNGGYVFRFIQSARCKYYFKINSFGITRYSLGIYPIENLFIPVPPLSEQNDIVSYLDTVTQKIDKSISIEEKKIELLKEYRQSLISNVVTGKVDVRNN